MEKKILDGKKIAIKINNKILKKIKKYKNLGYRAPGLAIILVGNNFASKIYVKNKCKLCKNIGFFSLLYYLPKKINELKIISLIKKLNVNPLIDGILLQLPLPIQMNTHSILKYISPSKDVDGFHPINIGKLCQRNPLLRPCTSYGIIKILKSYNINICGINAVIIGASNIVGRPMLLELLLVGSTVTITHKFTKNLKFFTKQADLLIVAIGKLNFIKSSWIKTGAIIIDVGINIIQGGKICGDVDFNNVINKVSYITPVPGGVGPVTVSILMRNTLLAYKNLIKNK